MKLYSENKNYKLYQGNMLDMLEVIEPNSIDSIVTDPPYELNFMGKGWDNAGVSFNKETWEKCFEVLKPGGYLLAFGGSRTYHRIAVAIEDAGFEIRDTIMWLYGSGFPKSMNVGLAIDKKNGVESKVIGEIKSHDFSKHKGSMMSFANTKEQETSTSNVKIKEASNEWQGWGTCLKPSFEPIIVARKTFKGSLVDNVIENGVGGINIDECRVEPTNEVLSRKINNSNNEIYGKYNNFGNENNISDKLGRFPANTILTYDETDFEEVCGGFPNTKSAKNGIRQSDSENVNCYGKGIGIKAGMNNGEYGDSGSASRYFYCAKASKKDRDEGLGDNFEKRQNIFMATCNGTGGIQKGMERFATQPKANFHPTVKPTELMQYLVRLVTPNGGIVLDPFNGSGSTGKAVMYENKERNKDYKYIGIELTEEYLPIAQARIEYVSSMEEIKDNQTNIFDFMEE